MLKSRLRKMKDVYHEYPRVFWILVVITFVDLIGGVLIFLFFALYLTSKFGMGMENVFILFAAVSFGLLSTIVFPGLHRARRQTTMPVAKLQGSSL